MRATVAALTWPSVVISVLAQVVAVTAYFVGLVGPGVALTVIGLQLFAGWFAVAVQLRARLHPSQAVRS